MTPAPIILGTDIFSGEVVSRPLSRLTHTLAAGATGAGKSVLLHCLASQLACHPDVATLYLVDFKFGVEFAVYEGYGPHVRVLWQLEALAAVATELLERMQKRFDWLRERGLRDWPGKRIFLIIDEISELQPGPGEKKSKTDNAWRWQLLEDLGDLGKLSRAAGIVIVGATQRPTSDSIASAVAANLGTRFCFRVATNLVASMVLGTLDDLRRETGLDPVTLPRGRCIYRDGITAAVHYLQPHWAPELDLVGTGEVEAFTEHELDL
jgi:S-DNA-T family DNA segregation ATPase FtsK/SpoIIIE